MLIVSMVIVAMQDVIIMVCHIAVSHYPKADCYYVNGSKVGCHYSYLS